MDMPQAPLYVNHSIQFMIYAAVSGGEQRLGTSGEDGGESLSGYGLEKFNRFVVGEIGCPATSRVQTGEGESGSVARAFHSQIHALVQVRV